ncbi:hypothetical protein [Parendozoicomonas sp. Alg238-R29]|uniref:hypothetical protein n=1 Tax=Parendozoicomonas sp. Alg238-R29 TaxID=2993446 RepID=UPI00248F369F|nr:hypothetical protein [Parendozoicomonas sp. Alg238-R29]
MPQTNARIGDKLQKRPIRQLARRISYPLRRLTSDAIAGQALVGIGGTLAGAGTGALILGASVSMFTRNSKWRATSISIGAILGGTVGSTIGGVSGIATGLFIGMVRLPFAIVQSFKEPDPTLLVTPFERTVKGGWKFLNDPGKASLTLKETCSSLFPVGK